MVCRHYLVTGRVQGVGFRKFVERQANGLAGWVRNLEDGRVEILARGTLDALAIFETYVQKGPLLSKVTNVSVNEVAIADVALASPLAVVEDGGSPWSEDS